MINYIKKICVLHVSSNGIFIHTVFPLLVILFITKLHDSGGADGGSGVRFLEAPRFSYIWGGPRPIAMIFFSQSNQTQKFLKIHNYKSNITFEKNILF